MAAAARGGGGAGELLAGAGGGLAGPCAQPPSSCVLLGGLLVAVFPGDIAGGKRGERQHHHFPFSPCLTSGGWPAGASQAALARPGPARPGTALLPPAAPQLSVRRSAGLQQLRASFCSLFPFLSHTRGRKSCILPRRSLHDAPLCTAEQKKKKRRYPFMVNF